MVRSGWSARRGNLVGALCLCAMMLSGCTPGSEAVIVLQVRWCVMEGSSESGGRSPGDLVSTHRLDGDALLGANEVWSAANIGFVQVVGEQEGTKGVPLIEDTDEFLSEGEDVGDIDSPSGDPFEALQAVGTCQLAWTRLDAEVKGPIVVTAGRFVHAGLTLAGASHPEFGLWVSGAHPLGGQRGDDLCGDPRSLEPSDVLELDGSSLTHSDVGWLVIAEPGQFRGVEHRSHVLAHELGHVLLLGHGNGIDDNGDGDEAGVEGIRRFDQYCDPLGSTSVNDAELPVEDVQAAEPDCISIMQAHAACSALTALQIEQARAAAALMGGCQGVPCKH